MAKRSTRSVSKKKPVKVAEVVGVASVAREPGLGKRIQEAMSQAIADAYEAGISDPEEHKKLMEEARERVKDEARQQASEASE